MNRARRALCAAMLALPACGDEGMRSPSRDLSTANPPDLSVPPLPPYDLALQGNSDLFGQCPPAGNVDAGPASQIAVGAALLIPPRQSFPGVVVCRDAGGLYAMNPTCTHAGCTVELVSAASGFKCPCHFGIYDFNGAVTGGPPPAPLGHFALCVGAGGAVIVDLRVTVPAATRV